MTFRSRFTSILLLIFCGSSIQIQLAQAQTFTILHEFTGYPDDGAFPSGVILSPDGTLYGTTFIGGNVRSANQCLDGCGALFKITTDGIETVLHNFGAGGALPGDGVIRDAVGNLYGTTSDGGAAKRGTVYEFSSDGSYVTLHSFNSSSDGYAPETGVIRDSAGNLYGTTSRGGARHGLTEGGTIYKLTPGNVVQVLYRFHSSRGVIPFSSLIRDAAGNFYGITRDGGDPNCTSGSGRGCGVVYKLSPSGKQTVLHAFSGAPDGASPYGRLVRDLEGNIYGVTFEGGSFNQGAIYKIDPSGNETVFYSFSGPDGAYPTSGLLLDGSGNFYGNTRGGGEFTYGAIFKLDTSGQETVLHSFNGFDGLYPNSELAMDKAGNLYGTTEAGGTAEGGIVFKLTP